MTSQVTSQVSRRRLPSRDTPGLVPLIRMGSVRAVKSTGLVRVTIDNATITAHQDGSLTRGMRVQVRFDPEKRYHVAERAAPQITIVYVKSGTLAAGALNIRIHSPKAFTIRNVTAAVKTAPAGDDLIVDVNLNGTTIFTTQANRPTILDGDTEDLSSVPDVTAVAFDDVLEVDIDVPAGASDLVVQVRG